MASIQNVDVVTYENYQDTDHILVDVREVDEYAEGHLPGAVNIPLSGLQANISQIPTDKTVLLVCRTGGRSMMAAEFLASTNKYQELVNLDGGTLGWMRAGKPIES